MFQLRGRKLRVETLETRNMLAITLVDTHFDSVDPNDGLTSLREAIADSNLDPDADEIRFAPWLEGQTIRLVQGELTITGELSIVGPGADRLTIDASGNDPTPGNNNGDGSRVFFIGNGDPDLAPQVKISGVTLTGGDVDGDGGAIWSEEFEAAGFATGTMTFSDQALTAVGYVDFTIEQRESTGALQLLAGSIEITTTANGQAGGAIGSTGSGVDIEIYDVDDDTDLLRSVAYNAGTNTIIMAGDFNSNGGFSSIQIQDLADAVGYLETTLGTTDFTIGTVVNGANFVTAADVKTHPDVLSGGSDQSTEAISLLAVEDLAYDLNLTFVEQAGVGATPSVSGNALDGYTIAIDSQNTNTAVADIASEIQGIDEISSASYGGFATFKGSLDNVPAAVTTVGGARSAGVDIITITANYPGTALNRTLSFNTLNSTTGDIDVSDDGAGIVVSVDSSSEYELVDIANTITTHLDGFEAVLTGDGSGTYDADNLNDNTGPVLSNVAGGANPADGSLSNAISKPLVLDRVLISGNHALGSGGGVFALGSIEIENSTIAGNTATAIGADTASGGGVYAVGLLDITNSTISDNSVFATAGRGGGVFGADILRIDQSTIAFNRAQGSSASGGGVVAANVQLDVSGSIVSENFATAGKHNVAASSLKAQYSLFGSLDGQSVAGTAVLIGVDPQLQPLGDYGGPTPTHSLQETSPAIDAGDPALVAKVTTVEFDQRGIGFSRVASGRIDLGAVEMPATLGDFNGDRHVTGADFLFWQRSVDSGLDGLDLLEWEYAYQQAAPLAASAPIASEPLLAASSPTYEIVRLTGPLAVEQSAILKHELFARDEALAEFADIKSQKGAEPLLSHANDPGFESSADDLVTDDESTDELLWDELLQFTFG